MIEMTIKGDKYGGIYIVVAFIVYLALSTMLHLSHGGIDPSHVLFWAFATVLSLLWLFYLAYQVNPLLSYLLLIPTFWYIYIVYRHANIPTLF